MERIYFFFGAAFLAFAGLAVAFFGLGALGFFVGEPLAGFLALDGAAVFFDFAGDLLGVFATFFAFDFPAAGFFVSFLAAGFFPDAALAPNEVVAFFDSDPFSADDSLKLPLAPFPLVCTNEPDVTADLRYFLMKGANFSASTL